MHIAAKKGNLDIVKFLVEEGIDIDARGGTFDSSALNWRQDPGYLDIVKYLVRAGAELDVSLEKKKSIIWKYLWWT